MSDPDKKAPGRNPGAFDNTITNQPDNSRISSQTFKALRYCLNAAAILRDTEHMPTDALGAAYVLVDRISVDLTRLGGRP